jgi:hypothetical protein
VNYSSIANHTVSKPMKPTDMSTVPLDEEANTRPTQGNVQGYVTTYHDSPATGKRSLIPVAPHPSALPPPPHLLTVAAPFTSGIPTKTGWNAPPPPQGAASWGRQDPATVPFASFEQSAPNPYGAGAPTYQQPLPCGCGIQWTLFCVGWLLWPLWYFGAVLKCFQQAGFDPRERSGYLANVVMSVVFTVVWVSLIAMGAYDHYGEGYDCVPDPLTGLCL